ncbi:MAG: hypothetical protein ACE5K7_06760 [Phycisphaerae bacterium]
MSPDKRRLCSLRLAARFLWGLSLPEPAADVQMWRKASWWFLPLGLLVGLAWVTVFAVCKRQFRQETALHVMPALAVVVVDGLLLGHGLLVGLAHSVERAVGARGTGSQADAQRQAIDAVGMLVLILSVAVLLLCLMSLPAGRLWWPGRGDPRRYLNWAYPSPVYRPLLLCPLWGRWAVLLAAMVGPSSSRAGSELTGLSRALSPMRVLMLFTVPWFLTAIYCSRQRNLVIGTIISLIVLTVSYLTSVVLAYRNAGQSRQSVLAAGAIAQMSFLVTYLAFAWRIHG